MLVAGPGLDAARLTAAVGCALPETALAALTTAPVPLAAQTALTQGMAAAAGFGVLVLLLSLLLTARTREMTLARLATMGLRRWQAQLLAAESLPPVFAAAIGGLACAWVLGTTTLHAREYATMDRAGRVQLPREITRRLGMRSRVELQEEPDHIGVWPDQSAHQDPH
jgi:hypothetical protein